MTLKLSWILICYCQKLNFDQSSDGDLLSLIVPLQVIPLLGQFCDPAPVTRSF